MSSLRAEGLSKAYRGEVAVHELSFSLPSGQNLVLLGTSGSGKTTTLRLLNRLEVPDSGKVWLDEEEAACLPLAGLRRRMGYVIQEAGLFPHRDLFDNVATVPRLERWPESRVRTSVEEVMEQVGLPASEYGKRYPDELSGGQRQRIGLARAMAAEPPVLLMDEPFGALDPVTRQQLRADFLRLPLLRDKTLVMVTHDVEEAFLMADQLILMDGGMVQQQGRPEALLFHPANNFVHGFLTGMRFRLMSQRVQLYQLCPFLPSTPGMPEATKGKYVELPKTSTLSEALEALSTADGNGLAAEGQCPAAPMSAWLTAFERHRAKGSVHE